MIIILLGLLLCAPQLLIVGLIAMVLLKTKSERAEFTIDRARRTLKRFF